MKKYLFAFFWFVVMDITRDYFMLPKILEYVLVGAGVFLIFQFFDKNDKNQ